MGVTAAENLSATADFSGGPVNPFSDLIGL